MDPIPYKSVKDNLARYLNFGAGEARTLREVNRAVEYLYDKADVPGKNVTYLMSVYDRQFVLPSDLEVVTGISVNNTSYTMRSQWFDFIEGNGVSDADSSWITNGIIGRGIVCTQYQLPDPLNNDYTYKLVGMADERSGGVRPKCLIKHRQPDGEWVRTQQTLDDETTDWQDGEQLEINGDTPDYTTTSLYPSKEIGEFHKPITNKGVKLYANDGTNDIFLSYYASRETVPRYRRYFISDVTVGEETAILVRTKKKFQPIVEDNDLLPISDINVLVNMIQANLQADRAEPEGMQMAAAYENRAVTRMQDLMKAYTNHEHAPLITFGRTFGTQGQIADII